MARKQKRFGEEKHLFKSYYCLECKQKKPCRLLTRGNQDWQGYCCPCFYQQEATKAQEYTDYQQVYQQKVQGQQAGIKQLRLLRQYAGCGKCGNKEVDAYVLYSESKLVCQHCLVEKIGGASGALSWAEQSQWYQKRWGINPSEWLDKYQCLPVNAECAKKWLKDKQHLSNCACLEREAKEAYLLFTNSLREKQEKLAKCQCETSKKVRIKDDYSTACEGCGELIAAASKKRVIKNRNDPNFWGLEVKEKVLCGNCLEAKKKTWNHYGEPNLTNIKS